MRVLPSVGADLLSLMEVISAGFNEHVPFEDRRFDARDFLLRHRIHDWDGDRASLILRNCRSVVPDAGRLLISARSARQTSIG